MSRIAGSNPAPSATFIDHAFVYNIFWQVPKESIYRNICGLCRGFGVAYSEGRLDTRNFLAGPYAAETQLKIGQQARDQLFLVP